MCGDYIHYIKNQSSDNCDGLYTWLPWTNKLQFITDYMFIFEISVATLYIFNGSLTDQLQSNFTYSILFSSHHNRFVTLTYILLPFHITFWEQIAVCKFDGVVEIYRHSYLKNRAILRCTSFLSYKQNRKGNDADKYSYIRSVQMHSHSYD